MNNTQKTSDHIQVPLLHFKQDAFSFIKRNLGSSSRETGDSVMATISCLMLLEAASWEVRISRLGLREGPASIPDLTSVDKPRCPVGSGHAPQRACNCGKPPLRTAGPDRIDYSAKVPGDVSEAAVTAPTPRVIADPSCATRAISCVTRSDVQEQLLSTISSMYQCTLRCVLFIGLSPKPADAWWCADERTRYADSHGGPVSLLRETRGQQDPGSSSARTIAYMYLSLVLRPGRMSNEILGRLIDSLGTDTEGFERGRINNSVEQAVLFWDLMLSGAAIASLTPLSDRGSEESRRKQRLIERSIRSASAMLQLETWPQAVDVLKRVAFVEFEGEQELRSMWERATSSRDRCT
jgi:hypothetical protein